MPRRSRKFSGNVQQIPTSYDKCNDTIITMANEMIAKYHPELANCKIAYLWCSKDMKSKDRIALAKVQKVGPKIKALTELDFIITISSPAWKMLSDPQRLSVLDHELYHIFLKEDDGGDPKYQLIHHDLETFVSVVREHGILFDDIRKLSQVINQITKDNVDETKVRLNKSETTTAQEENITLEDVEKIKKDCITKIGNLLKDSGFKETAVGEFEKVDFDDCTFTKVP